MTFMIYFQGLVLDRVACVHAKSLQLCLTVCDPMDCGPPGSSVRGISQARMLECVVISFSVDLSDPGIEPMSPALQANYLLLWTKLRTFWIFPIWE